MENIVYEIINDDLIKITNNSEATPKIKFFSKKSLLTEKTNRTKDIEFHNEKISYHSGMAVTAGNRIVEIDNILSKFTVETV